MKWKVKRKINQGMTLWGPHRDDCAYLKWVKSKIIRVTRSAPHGSISYKACGIGILKVKPGISLIIIR